MKNIRIYLMFMTIIMVVCSCIPNTNKPITEINISLNDPVLKKIVQFQNEQALDSLMSYFDHENPAYRMQAVLALASIQNPSSLDNLYPMLDDPLKKVSSAAAYSIGQIGKKTSIDSLIANFIKADTSSVDNILNQNILEAIGKVGTASELSALAEVSSYRIQDEKLLLGQVRSFYRFFLKGIFNDKAIETLINYLNSKEYPRSVRLMSAHSLARPQNINIDNYQYQLIQAFVKEEDVDIKMALASALKKIKSPDVQKILLEQLELQQDYRVSCQILDALQTQDYYLTAEPVILKLDDENLAVAIKAAQFFKNAGDKDDAIIYRKEARKERPWQVKSTLYEAVMKNLPYYYSKTRNSTRWELEQLLKDSMSVYQQAGYLGVLKYDPDSYQFLIDQYNDENHPIINTTIVEALGKIIAHEDFTSFFKSKSTYVRTKILGSFKEWLALGDVGTSSTIGFILAEEDSQLKDLIDSVSFLQRAKDLLELPKDIEAYNAIEKAMANVTNVKNPTLTKVRNAQDVNFDVLKKYKDSCEVIVKTSRGMFTIELYNNHAPQSVSNFLKLIEDNYYDGKVFHRVVPNFVIQTGCTRGDGYGGLDYTIRSELGPKYYDDEGYVGMASAGNHTESTQWFVTHSPTPHLDGRYTIFGKVIEGMDVIHQIEVGDEITDLIIKTIQ